MHFRKGEVEELNDVYLGKCNFIADILSTPSFSF